MIDLDDFKLVNDTYGHIKGDEVLVALAEILRRNLPKHASAFRYGGEEFVLLFTKHQLNKVVEMVEKMRLEFSQQAFDFLEDTHNITFSGGNANTWTLTGRSVNFLIKRIRLCILPRVRVKTRLRFTVTENQLVK